MEFMFVTVAPKRSRKIAWIIGDAYAGEILQLSQFAELFDALVHAVPQEELASSSGAHVAYHLLSIEFVEGVDEETQMWFASRLREPRHFGPNCFAFLADTIAGGKVKEVSHGRP